MSSMAKEITDGFFVVAPFLSISFYTIVISCTKLYGQLLLGEDLDQARSLLEVVKLGILGYCL